MSMSHCLIWIYAHAYKGGTDRKLMRETYLAGHEITTSQCIEHILFRDWDSGSRTRSQKLYCPIF